MEPDITAAAAEKRKRSPSSSVAPLSAPPAKVTKTNHSQLSINYLSRQTQDDLPLLNKDDTLPNLLQLLTSYGNVLDRHESLASNLGARPLAPILIKRFERCFDAPPPGRRGGSTSPEDTTHTISWLEVIEFARAHPSQFTLSTFSEGKRVCQFYYPQKQLRVQISEDDFLFINSGRCQELIPPLPIWEDEEKEMGTCDVLDAKLRELTNAADMVAARTRQLSHRLKGRKTAILERRAGGGFGTPAKANPSQTTTAPPPSSSGGFTAVNTGDSMTNGESEPSSSLSDVRRELLRHFEGLPHNQNQGRSHSRQHSTALGPESTPAPTRQLDTAIRETGEPREHADSTNSSLSPVPLTAFHNDVSSYVTDNTRPPSTSVHRASGSVGARSYNTPIKHNFSRPLPPALETAQPFRPLCQAHMDSLPRGHRVLPPCDRCRRLRMDCVKNLTSCAGCTKKHARCHWREVTRDELGELDNMMDPEYPGASVGQDHANGYTKGGSDMGDLEPYESEDDDSNPLEDLEALGEKEDQREKELAEQQREDEEGLRKAKELASQGRENSLTAVQASDVAVEASDVPVEASHVPVEASHVPVEASHVPAEASDSTHASAANGLTPAVNLPTTNGGTSDVNVVSDSSLADVKPPSGIMAEDPANVPAEESDEAMFSRAMPLATGFHAVNGPANGAL
ncbi:GAL4-like Zn(II)2Cys6 (or C6 zinc) binuclear cluster DNA-binding domain [Teratosphaeria destructans]|uniref:GAL4-like Zn(II)2Cys6 (Or C6 zinc) binuclear cluster DNA-binding domain n=1 Tax=Teratosphaeria destructans TaxID=418781 RepID=A0A9W7SLM8_9PEZI|nr:GAL4-like Zn(II)2Cys6 (or C6 zinc) binuclear cluster DNA-binding domain [Teratosphaeria destructans]